MNGKSLLAAAAVAACLVVAGLLIRAVGTPSPSGPGTGHAPAIGPATATEVISASGVSGAMVSTGAAGTTGSTAALRRALVRGGCGGVPVWLSFDYPADWWLSDDAFGMGVQSRDPSVVSYGGDFAKAVLSICPKAPTPGPPTLPHTATPIEFAGVPGLLYSVDHPDAPEAGGLFLSADVTVDGSPLSFDGFVLDSDNSVTRTAYRAALDALLESVRRVSAPVPGPDWLTAHIAFGAAADGALELSVDAPLPPGWGVTQSTDGRSAVIAPAPGAPASAAGVGVLLERVDDPAAAGWDTGHPWLDVRLLDATTVYQPGRDGATDTWLAGGPTLAIRVGPVAAESPDVLADPLALHILSHATLRLTDAGGTAVPWPPFGLGYPSP